MKKISVVIPIYNEEENIKILYLRLKQVLENLKKYDYEIIFVDDGSTDNSFEILKEISNKDSKVKVIRLTKNFGQTSALMAGIDYAKGEIIITLDGDLQNPPEEIPKLISEIEAGYLFVSGWRKNRKDSNLTRKIPSKIANFLIRKITNVDIHDYGCTLKAYRSDVIKNIRLYGEMHRFIPALVSTVIPKNKIKEIVVKHDPRLYGKSKYGLSRTFKVLVDLLFVYFFQKFIQKPIHFFGIIGIFLFLLGVTLFLYLVLIKLIFKASIGNRPLLIISVMFILAGLQMINTGILGEILVRIYFESQNKKPYIVSETLNIESDQSDKNAM